MERKLDIDRAVLGHGTSSQTWPSSEYCPVSSHGFEESSGGEALETPKWRNSAPGAYVQFREALEQGLHTGFFSSHFNLRCLQVRLCTQVSPWLSDHRWTV